MSGSSKSRRVWLAFLCAACAAVAAGLQYVPFWQQVDFAIADALLRYGRPAKSLPDLVFLALDEPSITLENVRPDEMAKDPLLQKIQTAGWPWPRDVYPHIIEKLANAGAKVIALDMMFPTPRDGDEAFRAALEKHADKVVIGSAFADADTSRGQAAMFSEPSQTLIPGNARFDHRVGFVNMWPDVDGVVRRVYFRRTIQDVFAVKVGPSGNDYLALAARMLEKAGRADAIPQGTDGTLVRFPKPTQSWWGGAGFPPISIYEILVPAFWESPALGSGTFFRDKIILIGPFGNLHKDEIRTPLGMTPGPIVHLAAVNAALQGEFLRELPYWSGKVLAGIGGLIAWALAVAVARPIRRLALGVLALALSAGTAWLAASYLGILSYPGPLFLTVASASLIWFIFEQIFERRERLRTRRMMERYVSRNVVRELLDNPAPWLESLGGIRRPVAIMFTDLRGFTTLTERGDPHALVAQLNEYFARMVEIVFRHGGTLDKFIGDAIMAVWGNVKPAEPDEAVGACIRAAMEMREALRVLNRTWAERGSPELRMGFGINHGEVIVGNMGCQEKMEFTAIGDAVNLTSRLEGATKEYGLDLLIGAAAIPYAEPRFHVQRADLLQVKGKTVGVEVAAVLREKGPGDEGLAAFLETYHRGIAAYRARRFDEASSFFTAAAAARPDCPLCPIYLERCANLAQSPPPPDWNGVFVMTKK